MSMERRPPVSSRVGLAMAKPSVAGSVVSMSVLPVSVLPNVAHDTGAGFAGMATWVDRTCAGAAWDDGTGGEATDSNNGAAVACWVRTLATLAAVTPRVFSLL